MQIDVGDGRSDEAPLSHFREIWTRAFAGFLAGAADDPVPPPGLEIGFAPELLPGEFGYARFVPGPDGAPAGGGRPLGASPRAHPHRLRVLRRGGRRPLITTVRTSPEPPPIPHPLAHLVGDPATR